MPNKQPLFIFTEYKMIMKTVCTILIAISILSCNSISNKESGNSANRNIAAERTNVNPDPVKTYSETVKSFATIDEFKISVFETKQTFNYLIKIEYKNIEEEDTLRVPDIGILPSVEIEKGDSIRPSCIVGFLDQDKQFKESKLIYFDDDKLKVHVLKHYAVFTAQDSAK